MFVVFTKIYYLRIFIEVKTEILRWGKEYKLVVLMKNIIFRPQHIIIGYCQSCCEMSGRESI